LRSSYGDNIAYGVNDAWRASNSIAHHHLVRIGTGWHLSALARYNGALGALTHLEPDDMPSKPTHHFGIGAAASLRLAASRINKRHRRGGVRGGVAASSWRGGVALVATRLI